MYELTLGSEHRACHPPAMLFCCMAALLIELAQLPWRFDYCGLYALLKLEFPAMKHKKVYR
jgi:hypothetical protein